MSDIHSIIVKSIENINFATDLASKKTTCLRKSVGVSIVGIRGEEIIDLVTSHNGPSSDSPCSNVVGGCGCSHAEPRAILHLLKSNPVLPIGTKRVLLCKYSPCTNCANIILDSGIIDAVIYEIDTTHDMRGISVLKSRLPIWSINTLKLAIQTKERLLLNEISGDNLLTGWELMEETYDIIDKW